MSRVFARRDSKIKVSATGDSLITRPVSVYQDMEPLRNLIKEAHVRFTNCEALFHHGENYPMASPFAAGTKLMAKPSTAGDLKWIGFNLASLCNNHTMDFGEKVMFSTMQALEQNDIIHAGTGRDLDEAKEPRYLETSNGRVALIAAAWSDFQQPWERASNMKAGVAARPGINLLRVNTTHTVNVQQFTILRDLIPVLGLDPPKGTKTRHKKDEIVFLGHHFRIGDRVGTTKNINKEDLDDIINTVVDARKTADWVFVSFHTHDSEGKGAEFPSMFVRDFARACIHAGADAFLGHGAHILQGIEIYERKPIFYSLGNFIIQDEPVDKVSYDQYEAFGLDEHAKPSDFFSARHGLMPPSLLPYAKWWFESAVALFELDDEGLEWLKLYPTTMNYETRNKAQRGRPQIDTSSKGKATLERLAQLSSEFSTKIMVGDKFATIDLP